MSPAAETLKRQSGHTAPDPARPPRLGFLGVGWIGRHRMEALARTGAAEIAAIADTDPATLEAAAACAPEARTCGGLNQLLDGELDGVVIATPSALHAEQSITALERGLAVFCQKPLARDASEAQEVIAAARRAGQPLGVDLSYRHTRAMQRIRQLLHSGELGRVYAIDLVFHNAYGPDKPWFYQRSASGGGCVMDLGIHLLDLALWLLAGSGGARPAVRSVRARTFCGGDTMVYGDPRVEDYATIQLELEGGIDVRLACSWRLPAGRDAIIGASVYGTEGGASMRNVDGSFYDFHAERYRGTATEFLAEPPDDWGGRALESWARRVAAGAGFDPEVASLIGVHEVIDAVYRGDG